MTADDGPSSWDAIYRIRFDEAGRDGRLRTSGFMRYAQDLAWQHSAGLGFGRDWYAERGLTWLVRAAELVVIDPPEMGTDVAARTTIAGIRRVFARRHGEFRAADGRLTGWVDTDWVLIDARGAPTRIPPIFAERFGEGAPLPSIGRVGLAETPPAACRVALTVRPHEVDPYAHANNAVYLDWMEEAILATGAAEAASAVEAQPRRYRMEFALAAEVGARLEGAAWRDGDAWSYRLTGADGGPDRFRAVLDAAGGTLGEGGTLEDGA
ncbi:MAG TPA: acyl-ACP thioesterase domain-containing protein [Candidatus Limnocylindrales bacterium]|nr:acyl-ACP thioesterase domain-containing protein [Candidatus Limnocylindrales bacterium]